jgi:hypothetical protein
MTKLEELKAEEKKLWTVQQDTKQVYETANVAWNIVYREIQAIEAREKLRGEIMAEMAKEKEQNGNA